MPVVLNLPDQRDFTDLPTVCKIAVVYAILAMFIIPASYVILMLLMPVQLRNFKAAADSYEKTFWKLTIAGRVVMIASAFFFSLCFIHGTAHRTQFIFVGLSALLIGFGAICVADYFGQADKNHVWHKPGWLALKHYINQVIIDNDMILDRDPSLQSDFRALTASIQHKKMRLWKLELAVNEQRLTAALQAYRAAL
ncbi:MAG: hypothetical protein NVS3B3_03320 [Aquirhabdus sp.]